MTWQPDAPFKPEVLKVRDQVLRYCVGRGIDIGCGPEKITPYAIGIDTKYGPDVVYDLKLGLANLFNPNQFDYVFSSHVLEDLIPTRAILKDWWSLLKVGGYMVLYLPHKAYYPHVGQPGANECHVHDFYPQDIVRHMDKIATYKMVRNEVRSKDDEYSFLLVLQKLAHGGPVMGRAAVSAVPDKKALVIRWGAVGDHIIASSVLPLLKADGFHITYSGTPEGEMVLRNNPHIDELVLVEKNVIPLDRLIEAYEHQGEGYDRVVVLNNSLEGELLFLPDDPKYMLPDEDRRKLVGHTNYYRHACAKAGYPEEPLPRGQIFPDDIELAMGRVFAEKLKHRFKILWSLSGSSQHKFYPWTIMVINAFLEAYEDAMVITVGDVACQMLEEEGHPRWLRRAGIWDFRNTLLMTQHVDCVVSPETAVLNAAGCFDTPKIGFLTHSSKAQLTETFVNDYSMQADIACSPCHKMIYASNMRDCPQFKYPEGNDLEGAACACAGAFPPEEVFRLLETIRWHWLQKMKGPKVIIPQMMAQANKRRR